MKPSIISLLLIPLVMSGFTGRSVPPPPEPTPIDVTHYRFDLRLTDESNRIEGTAEVSILFMQDDVEEITLNLVGEDGETGMAVESVELGDDPLAWTHEDDLLQIELDEPADAGDRRTYTIDYHGIPADGLIISENKFGERTFFGDNWPERARHWLPTHDHPSDKARVDFVITAPAHYEVVAPGRLIEKTNLDGPWELTHWRATAPLPTYVMVIGVAPFAVDYLGEYDGTPVQSWVFPENKDAGFYDYAVGERILAFFEGHIGEFPYVKLANVQSKTRFGGMENAGAIFYNENSVTGTRRSEGLLAHEIAHQWFGDAVTEDLWSHFWLSEGFATYLSNVYMGYTYGRDSLRALMRQDRRSVLAFAGEYPDEPVVDTVFATPLELLNANSYEKGGWVLHMLRDRIGTEDFWDVLQAFYTRYKHGNALTSDFKDVVEDVSGREFDRFFRQWTRWGGVPVLAGDWSYDEGILAVTVQQTQDGAAYHTPLDIGLLFPDGQMRVWEVRLDEQQEVFTLELGRPPADVVLDPNVQLLFASQFD